MRTSYGPRAVFPLLVGASLAVLLALVDGNVDHAALLMKCSERQDCLTKRTVWEHFTSDLPSCLVNARVWWSSKSLGIPVTLVTQLSAERLDQLKAQCATWGGPLAAALYVPLHNPSATELLETSRQKLEAMIAHADELFRNSENNNNGHGCQLRLALIYELFADPRAQILYPVNSLRNYARLMADTDLIANIDVDMVPSLSISTALAEPQTLAEYTRACRSGAVYVLPAFETHCGGTSYADSVAVDGKKAVIQGIKRCVRRMRPKAPFSHNSTKYERWFATDEAYSITYGPLFEPWFISWRWGTLWYDYRYRGYGKNKIVQAAAMNATGAIWLVSPHGFLVHRPHTESRARKDFLRAKFSRKDMQALRGTVYEHVESLWEETKAEFADGKYVARVERDFQVCLGSLPWWQSSGGG
ncbi:hypothetical protein VOLCADRAFT_80793 [Volvox carteri f. nagariensis]|uniref:Uncharacterized protein n=1 Tax=Volvox carteri f. nagariensis TaxID=3068 RepID=D8TTK7_VOLCA|nr:uncharacterized protein VOLCADRAFT_80793 [Volvox carteri f. nagariensis]EFJ49324.1 hypothetical protein VOLCADRAFT_80793 [Volvox carteri f. nagariensis]|eukprot:XP_002949772.1 hypothetical protein VOLCADRAFT_80793 [Volvox carteri f. nagariensis]